MIYLEIDTDKEGYPLKEVSGGCDNHFDAGSEFINQTKKFFPGILDCKSIASRESKDMKERLLKCRFAFKGASTSHFYVFVFEIEGGGRGTEPIGEHRVQLRTDDRWKPNLSALGIASSFINSSDRNGKECYVIGIYRPEAGAEEVFCGFYPSILSQIESKNATSPKSVQIKIDTIRQAYIRGFGIQSKKSPKNEQNEGNVVTFKPKHLLWYMENRDKLHLQDIAAAQSLGGMLSSSPIHGTNKILYGAPGTGKSDRVNRDTGSSKRFRVTFHPDTDYSSFVGCYKPVMAKSVKPGEDDVIRYEFSPQGFLDAYVYAWKNPKEQCFLIIEEINRGNCAQIFGDIFQLLDRDIDGYSKYTIKGDNDIGRYLESVLSDSALGGPFNYLANLKTKYPEDAGTIDYSTLALPSNLSIIATLNTSDQSLYPMDSAFKRRWDWEYVPVNYDDASQFTLKLKNDAKYTYPWDQVLHALNRFITESLESADKTIGNRFLNPDSTVIDFKNFRDKALFFLFNDVFKDNDLLSERFGSVSKFESLFELDESDQIDSIKKFIDGLLEEDKNYKPKGTSGANASPVASAVPAANSTQATTEAATADGSAQDSVNENELVLNENS